MRLTTNICGMCQEFSFQRHPERAPAQGHCAYLASLSANPFISPIERACVAYTRASDHEWRRAWIIYRHPSIDI